MTDHKKDDDVKVFDRMFVATFGGVAFWFIISILVIYCRQSGQPFKSTLEYENSKYISIIFILWTIAFIAKIVFYLVFNVQGEKS